MPRKQPPPDKDIIAAIRAAMDRKGMNVTQLAEAIGWQHSGVSAYLNGHRDVSTRTLRKMVDALGLDIKLPRRKRTPPSSREKNK